jgi:acetamidase/formamidase
MADGEPTGTAVETSMDVEFSVDLRKKANLTAPRGPRLENSEYAHVLIGSVGKYDVVTVQGTMALKVPKRHLVTNPGADAH